MNLPKIGEQLQEEHINLLETFTQSCRHSIIAMVKQSQSGHPGGSLSALDYLALIYTFIIGHTGEDVVVSNGHISPGVYSVLAEMGYIPKQEVIDTFRKIGSIYEGHVTRHVPGVHYGTGPLGAGVSAAASFAWAEKHNKTGKFVYGLVGDGECQEGQVHEMAHFAAKYELNNLIMFCDYNYVQLTASLEDVMPIDVVAMFEAAGWNVIDVNGHDYQAMWDAIAKAHNSDKPTMIVGRTIMGHGVHNMEKEGIDHKATWHGKAPSPEMADEALEELALTTDQEAALEAFRKEVTWHPEKYNQVPNLSPVQLQVGQPRVYEPGTVTDCRGAYGTALLDLAKLNPNVLALTADLRGSVKTDGVADELPDQHIEVGIAEQNMVSVSGGLSLDGFIPFCSTFGAFMSSRAKDQARVNDINHCNVKMVATHCGLSVGEDGPTHQAIDDMGSFLGMFNTMILEPADANQCDRMIRFVASHYGNFYVRMGRHKFEVLTKEDGSLVYGADYEYKYGRTDTVRKGEGVTVVATGSMVGEALRAREEHNLNFELIAASSIKEFDDNLLESIKKTGKVVTVEDHNTYSGLGGQLARKLQAEGIQTEAFHMIGVEEYQLSGNWDELYASAGINYEAIAKAVQSL